MFVKSLQNTSMILLGRRDNRRSQPAPEEEHDPSYTEQIREALTRTKTSVDNYLRTLPRKGNNSNSSVDLTATRTALQNLSTSFDDFIASRNTVDSYERAWRAVRLWNEWERCARSHDGDDLSCREMTASINMMTRKLDDISRLS